MILGDQRLFVGVERLLTDAAVRNNNSMEARQSILSYERAGDGCLGSLDQCVAMLRCAQAKISQKLTRKTPYNCWLSFSQ